VPEPLLPVWLCCDDVVPLSLLPAVPLLELLLVLLEPVLLVPVLLGPLCVTGAIAGLTGTTRRLVPLRTTVAGEPARSLPFARRSALVACVALSVGELTRGPCPAAEPVEEPAEEPAPETGADVAIGAGFRLGGETLLLPPAARGPFSGAGCLGTTRNAVGPLRREPASTPRRLVPPKNAVRPGEEVEALPLACCAN
jgi:hypothetical protein